jgi:rhodanese-related sulfurtransferase
MGKTIKEALIILIIAAALAFAANYISPNGIPSVGVWYDNRGKIELEKPPSYNPKIDSLLAMEDAFTLWSEKQAVFIDTREPEEYGGGHIPGAINLPFEQWDQYWDRVKARLTPQTKIVCYCGGLDCELSLDAARELKVIGYPNAYIFFGGIKKWTDLKLPSETGNEK